jgi:hypothetical protein
MLAVAVSILVSCGHSFMLNTRLVGTDIRKAVVDGWDVQNVIASDIQEGQSAFFRPGESESSLDPYRDQGSGSVAMIYSNPLQKRFPQFLFPETFCNRGS